MDRITFFQNSFWVRYLNRCILLGHIFRTGLFYFETLFLNTISFMSYFLYHMDVTNHTCFVFIYKHSDENQYILVHSFSQSSERFYSYHDKFHCLSQLSGTKSGIFQVSQANIITSNASPCHQQPCYWLCRIPGSLFSRRMISIACTISLLIIDWIRKCILKPLAR